MPGARRSSSRSADHFASPTVSPVASTETSSLIGGGLRSLRLRFTRLGGPATTGAPSLAPSFGPGPFAFSAGGGASFGGVRELFFSAPGSTGFGISVRVTKPCPVVQRFVVSQ